MQFGRWLALVGSVVCVLLSLHLFQSSVSENGAVSAHTEQGENAETGALDGMAAANSVFVESKTVAPGATGVQVGVYINNSHPLLALVIPLEFRSIVSGAYISSSFAPIINPSGRVWNSPLGTAGANYPGAIITQVRFATPGGLCSGDPLQSFATPTANIDFISPDGTLLALVSRGNPSAGEPAYLAPGSDPLGLPSYYFLFDIGPSPGLFVIDTCCTMPANHLEFVSGPPDAPYTIAPSFTGGLIVVGESPDCEARSSTDRYLLTCPKGDVPFRATLLDGAGQPIVGNNSAYLSFSACSSGALMPVPGEHPSWPVVFATAPSDANGELVFNVFAGGDCADCQATIMTDCGFTATVPVHSLDVNGDFCISGADHHSSEGICRDYNADFLVNAKDFGLNLAHLEHCAPLGICDNLALQLAVSPPRRLQFGDSVHIDWVLSYTGDIGSCGIDSVVLRHFDCTDAASLQWVGAEAVDQEIFPAVPLNGRISYLNPDSLDFCLQARVYSPCCDSFAVTLVRVTTQRLCPVDTCFAFYTSELDINLHYFVPDDFLTQGWSYDVTTVTLPDFGTVTQTLICTGSSPVEGTSAYVAIDHNGFGSPMVYNVTVKAAGGDVCGKTMDCDGVPGRRVPDCIVSVLDVVCLVDYIFRNVQPSPCPIDNVDLNCDCMYDILDIVAEIAIVFRNQEPPDECDVLCP